MNLKFCVVKGPFNLHTKHYNSWLAVNLQKLRKMNWLTFSIARNRRPKKRRKYVQYHHMWSIKFNTNLNKPIQTRNGSHIWQYFIILARSHTYSTCTNSVTLFHLHQSTLSWHRTIVIHTASTWTSTWSNYIYFKCYVCDMCHMVVTYANKETKETKEHKQKTNN